jgi:hypothetical protein
MARGGKPQITLKEDKMEYIDGFMASRSPRALAIRGIID